MSFWRERMPVGMLIRSPWVASSFAAPGERTNARRLRALARSSRFHAGCRWSISSLMASGFSDARAPASMSGR